MSGWKKQSGARSSEPKSTGLPFTGKKRVSSTPRELTAAEWKAIAEKAQAAQEAAEAEAATAKAEKKAAETAQEAAEVEAARAKAERKVAEAAAARAKAEKKVAEAKAARAEAEAARAKAESATSKRERDKAEKKAAEAGEKAKSAEEKAAKAKKKATKAEKTAAKLIEKHEKKVPATEFLVGCVGPFAGCANLGKGSSEVDKYFSPTSVEKCSFYLTFAGPEKEAKLAKREETLGFFGKFEAMMYGMPNNTSLEENIVMLSSEADAAHFASKVTDSCNKAILVPDAVSNEQRLTTFRERVAGTTQGSKRSRTDENAFVQSTGLRPDVLETQFAGAGANIEPTYRIVGEFKHIRELAVVWKKDEEGEEFGEHVDVAKLYNEDGAPEVKRAVNQLYSYMVVLSLRYGYLSTYNTWWFMKRTRDTVLKKAKNGTEYEEETGTETLYISEPIHVDGAAGGFTLCEAYCYFALTAINDPLAVKYDAAAKIMEEVKHTYPDFPNNEKLNAHLDALKTSVIEHLSRTSTGDGGDAAGGSRQLQALVALVDKLPLSELPREPEYVETIARGRAGTVYKGRVEGVPFDVVIKIMDTIRTPELEDEMKLEYGCYRRMVPLWGTVVPFCIWGGSMPNFRLGLVTSIAGEMQLGDWLLKKKIEVTYSTVAKNLMDGLAKIHARGVAHSDINTRNIMIDDDGSGSVMFVDFGCSTMLEADGSNTAVFEAQKQEDLKCLATVLDIVKDYTTDELVEPSNGRAAKRISLRIA